MIPVTRPFLPPQDEYVTYIAGIWQRQWLTNMGPLANELEVKLKEFLNVENLLFVANGTVALQMAIKALNLSGEIITTPFSFVATTSAIVWENCTPVYCDIDAHTLNIDASKIESLITDKTSAILATHVYGNPCDVELIAQIAKKHKLKVIYDGAHAFGVQVKGKSIFEYGDISTCSLHATKLYHSIEGGLIIANDVAILKKLSFIRNFGFDGPEKFAELGINGKNSEMHAAMGLVNLKYISAIHAKRKLLTQRYQTLLKTLRAFMPTWHQDATINYAYLPIVFETEELNLRCINRLVRKEIFPRRYFYPALTSSLPYIPEEILPITEDISKRVLCLPLYYDLSIEEVDLICSILLKEQNELL